MKTFENEAEFLGKADCTYFLSVGSNLGDRAAFIEGAVAGLKAHPQIHRVGHSSWLETEPWGNTDQGAFLNGVIQLTTNLTPEALLNYMQSLEQAAGRQRIIHWGPRTLDLDIVWAQTLDGKPLKYESERLTIPHPYMWDRTFVLEPLMELYPTFQLHGETIRERIAFLKEQ
ncbi:2-amino-4-hydroxy-6-hydroxymethyldihydropteridine diphosphokinase [uncultured Veillonella sp.]|uniref:2-amino-4-hydroxy-6- hydroxymethyldihydropteridine diphosphokinase n=1 Tax=uncultured Veillonella sp. TaxID=159268 RepID=UPI002635A48D|nr:2-amino-4-hydroxy-6-hydroxymethyldihydropteridine diphosphokinase [uncultured Veillonella sp.]